MMWELMNEFGVDTVAGAATMYRMMLAAVPRPKTVYPGLRLTTAMSSGEILDPHTAEVWQKEVGIPLRNAVGMTPMRHVFLDSMWRGDKGAPGLSVGCPLPSYEAKLLGADGSNVDEDDGVVVGRLAVRRPTGITYWINNNEALTLRAAQDVIDGWSILDDAYARDAEGWLWFNGRLDDMIVTGGRQVAPVEVEEILAGHPAVAEVAVVPAPDEVRGQVVAAFITPTAGTVLSPELVSELQDHVKRHLAGYKYPRRIEFVDELPKDAVGKLSRRRLRESLAADGPRGGAEP